VEWFGILYIENIKIYGWITKLEAIKMQFACTFYHTCRKFEFLISRGSVATCPSYLVSWSLTSLFSTNMAISATNGQFIEDTIEPSVFLPGIISLVIICIGIIWNNSFSVGGCTRAEARIDPRPCERHALLHMAPKWFDHWTTWAGLQHAQGSLPGCKIQNWCKNWNPM